MRKNIIKLLILSMLIFTVGCSSTKFYDRMDTNPQDIMRGESSNGIKAREYLEEVLKTPQGREIKAYKRNLFSVDKKQNIFFYHTYYVFYKDGKFEHTLVYTATPDGSEHNGIWMLDADADIQSYTLLKYADNPWDMNELLGPDGESINLINTTQNIINRLDKNFKFSAVAGFRDLAWYNHVWMFFLAPPPILGYTSSMIYSINRDNCISALAETVEWNKIK